MVSSGIRNEKVEKDSQNMERAAYHEISFMVISIYLQVDFSSVIRTKAKMHKTEKKNCTSIRSHKKNSQSLQKNRINLW